MKSSQVASIVIVELVSMVTNVKWTTMNARISIDVSMDVSIQLDLISARVLTQ